MQPTELFEILMREQADSLMSFLRAMVKDPATAEDIFQETMITAWRTIDRFDRTRPFGPWLRGIARVLLMSSRRMALKHPSLCDDEILSQVEDRVSALQRLPGDTFDEKLQALRDCLAGLPENYRLVIDSRYAHELPVAEIPTRIGLNLETVKKRLQRGRALLLQCVTGKLASIEG